MNKVFEYLRKTLPQLAVCQDTVSTVIPPEIVKRQLVEQANLTLVFGFMGRIPNRFELTQWIHSNQVLGLPDAIDHASYLDKGFFSVRFKEMSAVGHIIRRGPLVFNRSAVCVIPWEPLFDS